MWNSDLHKIIISLVEICESMPLDSNPHLSSLLKQPRSQPAQAGKRLSWNPAYGFPDRWISGIIGTWGLVGLPWLVWWGKRLLGGSPLCLCGRTKEIAKTAPSLSGHHSCPAIIHGTRWNKLTKNHQIVPNQYYEGYQRSGGKSFICQTKRRESSSRLLMSNIKDSNIKLAVITHQYISSITSPYVPTKLPAGDKKLFF